MARNPEFCPKCKQLRPQGRDIVGLGWITCECDKPPEKPKELKPMKEKAKEPFVFMDTEESKAQISLLKETYTGPVITKPFNDKE